MDAILVAKSVEFVIVELRSIVVIQALSYTKTTNNVIFDKVNHDISFYYGQWNSLGSFSEVIRCCQYEVMTFVRWRINLPNDVHTPSFEWPRYGCKVQISWWLMYIITMDLAFSALLCKIVWSLQSLQASNIPVSVSSLAILFQLDGLHVDLHGLL